MTKWFEHRHAPTDQNAALPLTQESQGNLVLPTAAKVAQRWKMKEKKGKQSAKKFFLLTAVKSSFSRDTVMEKVGKDAT